MDIFSYQLGKKSSGGGGSSDEYFISGTDTYDTNPRLVHFIKQTPQLDVSNVTNLTNMFVQCYNLETVTLFDTSNATAMGSMFNMCYNLKNIPVLDTAKVTNMSNMFNNCRSLTDESLNNILQMCINAVKMGSGYKTLSNLGLSSTYYPSATIQGLSNYQAFIDAGWTIGY